MPKNYSILFSNDCGFTVSIVPYLLPIIFIFLHIYCFIKLLIRALSFRVALWIIKTSTNDAMTNFYSLDASGDCPLLLGGANKHRSLPRGDRKFAMITRTEETETKASVWKRHSASGNIQPYIHTHKHTHRFKRECIIHEALGYFVSQL